MSELCFAVDFHMCSINDNNYFIILMSSHMFTFCFKFEESSVDGEVMHYPLPTALKLLSCSSMLWLLNVVIK